MNEVIYKNWLPIFLSELKNTERVYIISPFVSKNIVDHLLNNFKGKEIKFITRFNLNDFRSGVSSLSALKDLVTKNVNIKGIKQLHSKIYLFDNKSAIITSANFTSGGFFNNYEFGVKIIEQESIMHTKQYFKNLWSLDKNVLTIHKVLDWEQQIKNSKPTPKNNELPDFGIQASIQGTKPRQYFIKFFGKSEYRENLNYTSKEEIERSHCHWALTFSGRRGRYRNGRPRKYKTGDIVYMSRMLENREYAIFGKGIAIQHNDKRDNASPEDIAQVNWKADWPVYIRVQNAQFIDGKMNDCPKLSELINSLHYDSFPTTQKMHQDGKEKINPWDSLRQQADIQLTDIGAEWLENRFQEALKLNGSVSNSYLNNLYQGTPTLNEILDNL